MTSNHQDYSTYGSTNDDTIPPKEDADNSTSKQTKQPQEEIRSFSSIIQNVVQPLIAPIARQPTASFTTSTSTSSFPENSTTKQQQLFNISDLKDRITHLFNPTAFLLADAIIDEDGDPYFEPNLHTIAAYVRYFFYDPITPEFTSLQQFIWAIILGLVMGLYTSIWKLYIEFGVELFWKTLPLYLYDLGIFTDSDGIFPLYHYMWIIPSIFGALLSYIYVTLPTHVPTQDQWISNVHTKGTDEHHSFLYLFQFATAAMWSGMSLGPELPLVLTGGMPGSLLGKITKQSVLQVRILNLTSASAAVGGFFGFPMAGALFVLELPHRMGLQYFEALSPCVMASIISVLTNSLILGHDVTGLFRFPFLNSTLPSTIFTDAVMYGFYGAFIGIMYVKIVKTLKVGVHDWFSPPHHDSVPPMMAPPTVVDTDPEENDNGEEKVHLLNHATPHTGTKSFHHHLSCVIHDKGIRAAVSGAIVGMIVGVVGLFLPHTMFWGEAQLQNLIDKGRTPLPIFSTDPEDPTSMFTKFAMCMIDPNNSTSIANGFGIECSSLLVVMKSVVIGLCLGTGIIGGQFWGPLYVGCAAAHLFTDICLWLQTHFDIGGSIAHFPCVAMICTMGATHVVIFRSHMGIMLVLTLTITAFTSKDDPTGQVAIAGDYSAIFPLLVVSVFTSLMFSRDTVFYTAQRDRGDITAVPEDLCQPDMVGAPVVMQYDDDATGTDDWEPIPGGGGDITSSQTSGSHHGHFVRVEAYGEIDAPQPSLLDQARMRSSTSTADAHYYRQLSHQNSSMSSTHHRHLSATASTINTSLE